MGMNISIAFIQSPPHAADRTPSLQRGKGGNAPGKGPPLFIALPLYIAAASRPSLVLRR